MAKHDSLRKLERNRLLLDYCERHPDSSLSEIGDVFGISKQRVAEIKKVDAERRKAAGKAAA